MQILALTMWEVCLCYFRRSRIAKYFHSCWPPWPSCEQLPNISPSVCLLIRLPVRPSVCLSSCLWPPLLRQRQILAIRKASVIKNCTLSIKLLFWIIQMKWRDEIKSRGDMADIMSAAHTPVNSGSINNTVCHATGYKALIYSDCGSKLRCHTRTHSHGRSIWQGLQTLMFPFHAMKGNHRQGGWYQADRYKANLPSSGAGRPGRLSILLHPAWMSCWHNMTELSVCMDRGLHRPVAPIGS